METKVTKIGSESFHQYLKKHKAQVKDKNFDSYYPVNVVAEAYTQGFSDGEKSGKQDFISEIIKQEVEKFTQKANQIYILSKIIISYLNEKSFLVSSLHINLTFQRPSVIIAVSDKLLNNDDFVKTAYDKLFEIKNIYSKLFDEYLDVGLVASDNLDIKLLVEDGFGYKEDYSE